MFSLSRFCYGSSIPLLPRIHGSNYCNMMDIQYTQSRVHVFSYVSASGIFIDTRGVCQYSSYIKKYKKKKIPFFRRAMSAFEITNHARAFFNMLLTWLAYFNTVTLFYGMPRGGNFAMLQALLRACRVPM